MLRVSQMERINVYRPKRNAEGDPAKMGAKQLTLVGKAHLTVFDPKGRRVVGFLIKKPDVASMIKVQDAFLALDSFAVCDLGLVATRGEESFDEKARERIGISQEWERCIIWCGMDAKTTDGKELGWVSDVEFSPKTGEVKTFFVGDGGVSTALVGSIEIPASYLRGYRDGYMLVDPKAAKLALDGGAAAKAGVAYAKAKYEGGKAAKKFANSAGKAVQRGAYGLGKMIGDTKRAFQESSAEELPAAPKEVPSISEPVEVMGELEGEVGEPREFVPVSELEGEATPEAAATDSVAEDEAVADSQSAGQASEPAAGAPEEGPEPEAAPARDASSDESAEDKASASGAAARKQPAAKKTTAKGTAKKPAAKKATTKKKPAKKSNSGDAARAVGRQLGKTTGMFGAFMREYKKASK